jgi:hypothetical protein
VKVKVKNTSPHTPFVLHNAQNRGQRIAPNAEITMDLPSSVVRNIESSAKHRLKIEKLEDYTDLPARRSDSVGGQKTAQAEDDGLEGLTVAKLKDLAETSQVKLEEGRHTKAEIVEQLRSAGVTAPAEEP